MVSEGVSLTAGDDRRSGRRSGSSDIAHKSWASELRDVVGRTKPINDIGILGGSFRQHEQWMTTLSSHKVRL